MNTCKTCKHWEYGINSNTKFRDCDQIQWTAADAIDSTVDTASIVYYAEADDDQGLSVGIVTGHNFGCIRYEVK